MRCVTVRYDILLLDADGTIFDFKRAEREAFAETVSAYGIVPNEGVLSTYSKINDDLWKMHERREITKNELRVERFARLGAVCGFDYDAARVADTYTETLATKSFILGNALEVCEKLAQSCRLYLITNGFKRIQEARIASSPFAKLFSGVFISENIGYEKPDVQYFDAVLKGLPISDKTRMLVIGDSVSSDIMGGINAGIDVCWFNPDGAEAPQGVDITFIINDLAELHHIIK